MITKQDIIREAEKCGFEDTGFTTADPFDDHRKALEERWEEYAWVENAGLGLLDGTDPKSILPEARAIIVVMELYFRESYPKWMEGHFGRCYLDDDRVTKDGLAQRIRSFRNYLLSNGINSKIPFNLPHRVAAARAGMGTFGKNCLFYANKAARKGSWVLPIAFVVDRTFEPDAPSVKMGCPDWCRNACIAACPTKALKGNARIDPRKCISYLSYFGKGITPVEMREPMGLYVYGCDRCQNVCPRNLPWLAKELPMNQKVLKKAEHFNLSSLLHMDTPYFKDKIWPHMFYMSHKDMWRWKMNVARTMGNTNDPRYTDDLAKAFEDNHDDRVTGMIAWALGRLPGEKAKNALERFKTVSQGSVLQEVTAALMAQSYRQKN